MSLILQGVKLLSYATWTSVVVVISMGASSPAECAVGLELFDTAKCGFFVRYQSKTAIDDRLEKRIPAGNPADPPIRSFAMVVGVSFYPNFPNKEDRYLAPAKNDVMNLVKFLERQKFDEVILLENFDANKENINFFLDEYLPSQLDLYGKRARVLFIHTGHGAAGAVPGQPGSLVLSGARGARDYSNIYQLRDLSAKLEILAQKSYHFAALLGSCYSGGVFSSTNSVGDNSFYPGEPGAHAVTSTKDDDLAYGLRESTGSVFFDGLIEGVESGKGDRDYSGWIELADGGLHLVGGGIIRLGAVTAYISARLDNLGINPRTNRQFPQLRFGTLRPSQVGGAFFFLGPEEKEIVVDGERGAVSDVVTGSAILGHPDLKVYNPPDAYLIRGINVGEDSTRIEWSKLREQTVKFAYLRTTKRDGSLDDSFRSEWNGAASVGLFRGAIHTFTGCDDVDSQFGLLERLIPADPTALPIAIDLNSAAEDPKCIGPKTPQQNLSLLIQKILVRYGKRPILLGGTSELAKFGADELINTSVWLKDYKTESSREFFGPSLAGGNPWSFWQFNGRGEMRGVAGYVGLNAFFGTQAQFARFAQSGDNVALDAALGRRH
ncbi:hypothetical protein HFN01_07285 [Rhizobium leguminosarum]|uniref:GH25 family lysozyme n=1 Tax=Rhizobium leguminosarum TaxID=384 RepID=UPI001C97DA5B|nr:GH25 family lysozyme [Rhizobium leguminosarum]MBY5394630.1 hypothetical protein [Rhizobium leguminosarum]